MLVSFFSTEILASFTPKYNTRQCVTGAISLPEHYYPQAPCQGVTLHGHSYWGSQPVPHLSLEVNSKAVDISSWGSACTADSPSPGEVVNAPSQMKAAETLTTDDCQPHPHPTPPPAHRCHFGNHLRPLPLFHRCLVMPPARGCIILLAPSELVFFGGEPSTVKRKIVKIKFNFLFNGSQETGRGSFLQSCRKGPL